MKYRIVERKKGIFKTTFKPQYKTFLFWKNIGENSTFMKYNKDKIYFGTGWMKYTTDTYSHSSDVIIMFKRWYKTNVEENNYMKIHIVK